MADIIKASGQGKKKSHIISGANVSHAQLEQYLTELQGNGLLEKMARDGDRDDHNLYIATDKGRDFLNAYEDVKRMLDVNVDEQIDEQVYERYSAT